MALLQTLTDNFNDNSVDTGKWPSNFNFGGNTLTEAGGEGRIALSGGSPGYSAYYTGANVYDLTGSYAALKAVVVPSNSTQAQAYIKLALNGTNYIAFGKQAGNIYFQRQLAGVDSTTTLAYNSTDHRWWRIRESGGNILWDTSPDGLTWTNRRSLAPGFAITSLTAEVGAGCWQVETAPGSFNFDDFNNLPVAAGNTNQPFFGII